MSEEILAGILEGILATILAGTLAEILALLKKNYMFFKSSAGF